MRVNQQLEIVSGGATRQAIVHGPAGSGPLPVVLLLHGSGGTGAWALRETRLGELAERERFLVVAPDATCPEPDQPARFYSNPRVWNDGSQRPPADRVAHVDDVAFLVALLDELPHRYPVDPHRMYVAGFSNGAGMTFRLAEEQAQRLAAIAPVAGHPPSGTLRPSRPVPTLCLAGDRDPLIPAEGGTVATPWAAETAKPALIESWRRWADALNCAGEPEDDQSDGSIRRRRWGGGIFEGWLISGLGHHWPGGRGELNRRIAGPPSDAVDGSRVIWEFFARHRI